MIKFLGVISTLAALSMPVSVSASTTSEIAGATNENVRQAVCVRVVITNPDGSGSSKEQCETDSSGRT